MNTYVVCAEHDKSCPYADAWQLVAYSLFVRNVINHVPTAHALPYSTYSFFANFTYTTCNFQRKRFVL